jgi:hypothetical protein
VEFLLFWIFFRLWIEKVCFDFCFWQRYIITTILLIKKIEKRRGWFDFVQFLLSLWFVFRSEQRKLNRKSSQISRHEVFFKKNLTSSASSTDAKTCEMVDARQELCKRNRFALARSSHSVVFVSIEKNTVVNSFPPPLCLLWCSVKTTATSVRFVTRSTVSNMRCSVSSFRFTASKIAPSARENKTVR